MKKLVLAFLIGQIVGTVAPRNLSIEERIQRYQNEYLFGRPEGPVMIQGKDGMLLSFPSRAYTEKELQDYILYRLKREQYEHPCTETKK